MNTTDGHAALSLESEPVVDQLLGIVSLRSQNVVACLNPSGNSSRDPSTFHSNLGPLYLFKTSATPLRGHMLAGRVLKVFSKRVLPKK
jgi:hypothetical protein